MFKPLLAWAPGSPSASHALFSSRPNDSEPPRMNYEPSWRAQAELANAAASTQLVETKCLDSAAKDRDHMESGGFKKGTVIQCVSCFSTVFRGEGD